jgi:hypothetical protein
MILVNPRIVPPNQIEYKGKNQTTITIDPSTMQASAKKDGTDAWFSYTLLASLWITPLIATPIAKKSASTSQSGSFIPRSDSVSSP